MSVLSTHLTCSARFTASLLILFAVGGVGRSQDTQQLDVLREEYPRAFFFRASEQAWSERRYPSYENWAEQFDRLQGIMGKCLNEECQGREPRNIEFFSRFKREHPRQVVLLHFNGNARDPRYYTDGFFAGHWIYRRAVGITRDVPAEQDESIIHVEDVSDFRVNAGRYRTSNDDIALFGVTDEGKHDWYHCEQVQLLEINARKKTIRVRRGCYGTRPLEFQAGRSRAAAHQVEGPWGRNNNLMWYYNYSAQCPRDRQGRTCSDLLLADLTRWFKQGGKLAAFDGLEFDVMFNQTHGDTDGDGEIDNGVIRGVNEYGIGVVHFARELRKQMGDDFIIQADGALGAGGVRSQRAWGILNGIESEGWPDLRDWEMEDWSGGLNRHFFWRDNAHEPAFSYVNHKWIEPIEGKPGRNRHPEVPFSRHRLVFAACQFFDAATCYSLAPPRDPGGKFGVWDELRGGKVRETAWLGRPLGPPMRMAKQVSNSMAENAEGHALADCISGAVRKKVTDAGVRIEPRDPEVDKLRFKVKDVPTRGPDLLVTVRMHGERREGYLPEMARFAQVGASGGMIDLLAGEPLEVGMKRRDAPEEVPLDKSTGAMFRRRRPAIEGKTLSSYFVHPPYRNTAGYVFWEQEADVPEESELRFSVGMGPKSPARSDGVRFEVHVAPVKDGQLAEFTKVFEYKTNQHTWTDHQVELTRYAGQRVRFKFVADCGSQDDTTTDHAHWGRVQIVSADANDQITETKRFMTWLNERSFESSFYYPHIRSKRVDLSFAIEGSGSVTLESVAAFPHPDAICRLFEHGVVLANPSQRPYRFDLGKIAPGRKFRRLEGTANQDPETNNGQPVGDAVTLGPRDGLFLRSMEPRAGGKNGRKRR